jgi:hypothetical protein
MTEVEFSRFIKGGLGTPGPSGALATRVAAELSVRGGSSSVGVHLAFRRIAGAALALGLIGALNLGGAYFFPRYGTGLANTPLVGGVSRSILGSAGLLTADTSAMNDVSTSNGHTIRLVGAYADGLQTVFLIQIDNDTLATAGPPSKADNYLVVGDATLTDQFGRAYQRGGTPSGDQRPVVFGALTSPAAENGARLTLHVQALFNVGNVPDPRVDGDWTLHATLFQHSAHVIPLPAPIHLGGNTYTFTSIKSSTVLQLSWTVTGPELARAWSFRDQGAVTAMRQYLPSLTGVGEISSTWGFTLDPSTNVLSGQITAILQSPGECTIRFGSPEIGFADRTIVIPKN